MPATTGISKRGGRRPGAGRKPSPPPVPDKPLGAPPSDLSDDARKAWRELATLAKPGTLTRRHRLWLEGLAQLLARVRTDEWNVGAADLTRLQAALVRLGLVP